MPVVLPTAPLLAVFERAAALNSSLPAQAVNNTSSPVEVVCAWPVSGQYGPGTRILYYVLVAACVIARKTDWLRDACLAAALLFPAVAALHGIVLAALHVNGAVDMDIYGAFQLCAIGILTAPPTVRLSKTYWSDVQGRNVIFLWTTLILAGLLSLTVEFYRATAVRCKNLLPGARFPYGVDNACGLVCSVDDGPFSPMRQGSANNIYVIPIPQRLTFGMGTLFTAACCVPAILSIVSIWFKISELNRKKKPAKSATNENPDVPTERIDRTNKLIRGLLSVVEIPVYAGAVLALVILGELNFWSHQVYFMTERIAAIGQWSPIAGTVLAVLGAVLLQITKQLQSDNSNQDTSKSPAESAYSELERRPTFELQVDSDEPTTAGRTSPQLGRATNVETATPPQEAPIKDDTEHIEYPFQPSSDIDPQERLQLVQTKSSTKDAGRSKFANLVTKMTGNEAFDRDQSSFQAAKKEMPMIPNEHLKNKDFYVEAERFRQHRSSFNSAAPSLYEDSDPGKSRAPSPLPAIAPLRSASTLPTSSPTERTQSGPSEPRLLLRGRNRTSSDTFDPPRSNPLGRSQTLEVPRASHDQRR